MAISWPIFTQLSLCLFSLFFLPFPFTFTHCCLSFVCTCLVFVSLFSAFFLLFSFSVLLQSVTEMDKVSLKENLKELRNIKWTGNKKDCSLRLALIHVCEPSCSSFISFFFLSFDCSSVCHNKTILMICVLFFCHDFV